MTAREYFEWVRGEVLNVAEMELRKAELEEACGPHGIRPGAGGGGGRGTSAMDRLLEHDERLERAKAELAPVLDRTVWLLYGTDGRGGLAGELGTATADCICGYYLLGMSWPEVARDLVRPDSRDASAWCRMRAARGLAKLDRMGNYFRIET